MTRPGRLPRLFLDLFPIEPHLRYVLAVFPKRKYVFLSYELSMIRHLFARRMFLVEGLA
jgi:hypothetical protein